MLNTIRRQRQIAHQQTTPDIDVRVTAFLSEDSNAGRRQAYSARWGSNACTTPRAVRVNAVQIFARVQEQEILIYDRTAAIMFSSIGAPLRAVARDADGVHGVRGATALAEALNRGIRKHHS